MGNDSDSLISIVVTITAHPGKRDELLESVLGVAKIIGELPECLVFAVNESTEDPDTLVMYDVFRGSEPGAEFPGSDEVQALGARAQPLIAKREQHMLRLAGGKTPFA